MAEELRLTLEGLERLWEARSGHGWSLQVYDYGANRWLEGDAAFSRPGTYEQAVLTGPVGQRVRVRLLPPGSGGLAVDPASAGEVAVWRAMGADLRARHLEVVRGLLEGREGPVPLGELAAMLEADGSEVAREVLAAISGLLPPPARVGHGGGAR